LVLDRKATSVKFNGTSIVTGELTNRKEVAHQSRGNQNIVKVENRVWGRECGCATAGDRDGGAIANCYTGGRRGETGEEYTIRR